MGNFKLHIGPAGSYFYFKKDIETHINSNQANEYIYILPVNRAVRYFQKLVLVHSAASALIDPHIFTYTSMMRYIYRRFPDQKKVVTNTPRLIFVAEILKENAPKLKYFTTGKLSSHGLIRKIDQMLLEFCQFGYQPKDFIMAPLQSQEKYHDFAQILTLLYQKYNGQLIDEQTMMLQVIDTIDREMFSQLFPHVKKVYLDGYGIYTPPMLKFITKIKEWCDVEIKLDYNAENPALFEHVSNAYDALSKLADEIEENKVNKDIFYHGLFKINFPLPDEEKNKNKITIQAAQNRREEVAYIAATIKRFRYEEQIPLHKIGVTFPDMEQYVPLIRTIFKDYQIPYNLSTGFILAQAPLVQCFLKVLDVIISGFECNKVSDLLVTPFLRLKAPIDVGAFKRLVIALRLTHLRGNWEERVNSFIANDERKRKMISEKTPNLFIEKCKSILAYLPVLISRLKMVPQRQTAEQFRVQYLQLLDDLGMLTWYKRDAAFLSQTEREKEFRAFNKFIKLFDQLLWTIRFIHGEKSFTLSEYHQYLMLITSNITYNLREWSNYGVQVLPRLEIQSAELNILIMGGLVEGKFPRNFTRDIFFNDTERQMMGLNATEDLLAQDRFLFYQLLSLPIQKIILTHPDYEQDAKLLPSTFISNLKDVAEVNPAESCIDKSYLLSRHNLLQYIAEELQDPLSETNLDIFENALQLYERDITKFWLKGIDILYAKLSRKQITNYEGYLSANDKIREIMHAKSLKPISVTALESYAFCPMQFFLQRIIKLEEDEEMEITVTALEKGLLIHKILFRFYTHLKEKNKQSRPWLYKKQLHKIANEEFAKMPYQGLFWILENESVFGSQDRPGLWDAFIDLEQREITRTGFEPYYFEVSFGRTGDYRDQDKISKQTPLRIEKSGRKVDLIGKIDRIDMDAQGNLMVIDYKISRNIGGMTFREVFEGSSLQLPLYLHMIYNHLKQLGVSASPQAGMYYQVRDADNCKRRIVFADSEKRSDLLPRGSGRLPNKDFIINGEPLNLHQMIDRSLKFVFNYVESLSNGIFIHTHDPKNQRCEKYCSYKRICRKDIAKMLSMKDNPVD